MVLKFILLFGSLHLAILNLKKRGEIIEKTGLRHTQAVEIFEYAKK